MQRNGDDSVSTKLLVGEADSNPELNASKPSRIAVATALDLDNVLLDSGDLLDQLPDDDRIVSCLGFNVRQSVRKELVALGLMALVIVTGTADSIASRIKGQAMGRFNFFASLGSSFWYVYLLFPFEPSPVVIDEHRSVPIVSNRQNRASMSLAGAVVVALGSLQQVSNAFRVDPN